MAQAQTRNGVGVLDPQSLLSPYLNVIAGLDGVFENVHESRQRPGALVNAWVLGRDSPHPNFAVLVTCEELLPGDYNRFHQAAVGLEAAELLEILPNSDVLAVGAGVQQVSGGGQRVDVPFLANKGADEAVLRHVVFEWPPR